VHSAYKKDSERPQAGCLDWQQSEATSSICMMVAHQSMKTS